MRSVSNCPEAHEGERGQGKGSAEVVQPCHRRMPPPQVPQLPEGAHVVKGSME